MLTFKLNDDGKLQASFEVSETMPPLDEVSIKEELAKSGFANIFLYENALTQLVKLYRNPSENNLLAIGERRDGSFSLKMDADKMVARLTLTPPYGGAPVTQLQIQLALQEMGVVCGIMADEIEAALKVGSVTDHIIAQGLAPEPGIDAQFKSLIPEIKERKPQVDEHGIANYRDLGQLIAVKQGDPLMIRTPASPGKNGQDISGQTLMPPLGQDTPFASDLSGSSLDPNDGNVLLAAISGQPKSVRYGVIVEPTISLPRVDMSTGNVYFDGTINVKGDVKDGMKIHTTGDVYVSGTVEAAEIEAGGDVTIKGGIIGHSGDPNGAPSFNAHIISKGSISVRFAENVYMEADNDILIEELSMHNHLTSLNRIMVGKVGRKKGHIIGGVTSASVLVKAAIIGSKSGFETKVRVGFNPVIQAEIDRLKHIIDANGKELEGIHKIVNFVLAHPEKDKGGLLDKLYHTRDKLETDCAQLHADCTHLLSEMTMADNVQVIVEHAVHSGVEVQIGNSVWKNTDERGKGVFQLIDGHVEFGNTMLRIS